MKKTFTILFVLLLYSFAQGQPPKKILFIGNSFTASNDLHVIVRQFFEFDITPVITESYAPGGISVGDVSMGMAAHMNNPLVFEKIREQDWDFVVLQDNQGRFAADSAIFPSSSVSKVIEGHLKIRDSLQYYHPCAKMIWFSGWGAKGADSGLSWIDKITVNYRVLNDSAKDVIAPIGSAWKMLAYDNPFFANLWESDDVHPNMNGSYLTAAIIYGVISQRDVMLNMFNYSLPPHEADHLKGIAQRTLTEPTISLKSNLEGVVSAEVFWDASKGLLSGIAGKGEYRWYLDNTLVATTVDSFYTPTKVGNYRLWTKDAIGYWQKSCTVAVNSITTSIEHQNLAINTLFIYPNPSNKVLNIKNLDKGIERVEVYSMMGQKVLSAKANQALIQVNVSSLGEGFYFLKAYDKEDKPIGGTAQFQKN